MTFIDNNIELTYHRAVIDGVPVKLPNLTLDKAASEEHPLGRWGLERQKWLGETNSYGLYLMKGTLFDHLRDVDQQAEQMEERLKQELMEKETTPDRQSAPQEWSMYMANLQNRVDEVIRSELIQV